MELYQIGWGAFALLVLWSIGFMPSLRLPVTAYRLTLKAQELILLAGLTALMPAAFMFGYPDEMWQVFGNLVAIDGALVLLLFWFTAIYLATSLAESLVNNVFKGDKGVLKRATLAGERYPVHPQSAHYLNLALASMYKVLKKGQFTLFESEALPYEDAKPSSPNAGAMGCYNQRGVVIWAPELATKLMDSEFMAIIAHEAAHIKNRDSVRKQVGSYLGLFALAAMVLAIVLGGASYLILLVLPLVPLIKQAMSRKWEALADFEVVQHGLAHPLASALATVSFEKGQESRPGLLLRLLLSHPDTNWRIAALETYDPRT